MRNLHKLLVGAALCASLATATGAQATVLFSDTFNTEHGGTSALNYNGFAQWTVDGQVDLVREPGFGITCNHGSCVDLDGTAGPGEIISKVISFGAGDHLVISFDVSGNQRNGDTDEFDFRLVFVNPVDLIGISALTGFSGSPYSEGFQQGIDAFNDSEDLAGNYPWTHYSLAFTASQAGSLNLHFGTTSGDDVGPLVDNVLVTRGGVPEPATWVLMIGGLGMAGATLRRRRAAVTTA